MPLSPQQSLERYELLDRIAVGGMAEVFRAKAYGAHGFEKSLAIKRILPELARDPEFEERFISEAKLAVRLTHANVVQVFDFGRTAGTLFIAMEYVDGLDLAALLKRYRERDERVPIPAAFQIAVEIARGLDFAHQRGVVHRDVSPSNILLSRAGEVKIADFGIALAAAAERPKSATGRRRIMGKWRYMSPEQTSGETVGTRSDLFSAASVMYEVFTGDKLFPGDEADAIIENIHGMELPLASERRTGLPPRLDEVLGRALARDPEARWSKAAEMLRALIEVSYESSIVATALDVSEAVGEVIQPEERAEEGQGGAGPGLDELIQAQLLGSGAEPADSQRRTAVGEPERAGEGGEVEGGEEDEALRRTETHVTLVKKGVDPHGVTLWEYDEDTVAAGPRARRKTGQPPDGKENGDEDRGAGGGEGAGEERRRPRPQPPERAPHRARLRLLAAAGVVVAFAAAGAVYTFSQRSGAPGGEDRDRPVTAGPSDAAPSPAAALASLDVRSVPAGAQVRIDGELEEERTPLEVEVVAGRRHHVVISLEGHRTFEDEIVPDPGVRIRLRPTLTPLRAGLAVRTRPSGATVLLDGEELGVTPLERDDLRPGEGRRLVLRKEDHHPVELEVDLVADEVNSITRRLESSIRYGEINLRIEGSWANVSLGGKRVGQAPGRLRLPVGRHRLRLHNPEAGKSGAITVVVREDRIETYEARL